MTTSPEAPLPLLRLLQLVSPSLPVGAFAYSQGLEWAVEAGWVTGEDQLADWLGDQLHQALARVDLPLLARLHQAAGERSAPLVSRWIDELIAMRDTAELAAEERSRGRALAELLDSLGLLGARAGEAAAAPVELDAAAPDWKCVLGRSQLAGFAFAAAAWRIGRSDAMLGYAWSWAENLTLAGVKLVPLGQTAGQQILTRLAEQIPSALERALSLDDRAIGASSTALAIASSMHETQYTRLYRS